MHDGQQRTVGFGGHRQQGVADLPRGRRVQGRRGLVSQHEAGALQLQTGDRDLLPLSAGQTVGPRAGPARKAQSRQGCVGLGNEVLGVPAAPTAQCARTLQPCQRTDQHVLARAQARHQMQALHQQAGLAAQCTAIAGSDLAKGVRALRLADDADRAPEDLHPPLPGLDQPADQLQQRALSGAIGSDDGHPLAGIDRQCRHLEQHPVADDHPHPLEVDRRRHSSAPRMRRDSASNTMTSATTTMSNVASRLHWNRLTASLMSRPRPPAPMRPRMVESRMLNSQTYR